MYQQLKLMSCLAFFFVAGVGVPVPSWGVVADPATDRLVQSPARIGETRSIRQNNNPGTGPDVFGLLGNGAALRGTFEHTGPPTSSFGWTGHDLSGAGDFSDFFFLGSDSDDCSHNTSAVAGFYSLAHTHASTAYGLPGFPVVPYGGTPRIFNEIQSPVIPWDLPGTADDGVDIAGSRLRFSIWKHLPFEYGMGYYWRVRTRTGGTWSAWLNNGVVEYGSDLGIWVDEVHDLTHLLPVVFDDLQVALGVIDRSGVPGIPGGGATLSPLFDDIVVEKYRVGGPHLEAQDIDLFQDSFPQSGQIDASTQAGRDLLDVRVDAGRAFSTAPYIAQDAMHVLIRSVTGGVALASSDLRFALHINPYFENAIRANLTGYPGVTIVAGGGIHGWDMALASVAGVAALDPNFVPIPDTFAFDLPDDDFMYPGDVLEYYVESTDSVLRVTTLPADISGFGDAERDNFDPVFQMRALPTIGPSGQPELLFVNQAGHRGSVGIYRMALQSLGIAPGVDYDEYITMQPEFVESNSIGFAGVHGANSVQLEGYSKMLYVAGNLDRNVLSTGLASNPYETEADDAGVITAWSQSPGDRSIAYFGDDIVTAHQQSAGGPGLFLSTQMSVSLLDDRLAGVPTQVPCVVPVAAGFSDPYAIGPCGVHADFDHILAQGTALVVHRFQDSSCTTPGLTASVLHSRVSGGWIKNDLTHVFDLTNIIDQNTLKSQTAVARYLDEVLAYFSFSGSSPVTAVRGTPVEFRMGLHPNPANPRTTIQLELPRTGEVEVRIFNIRGEIVSVVWSGQLPSGPAQLIWDGKDRKGASVPSGVYFARVDAGTVSRTQKLVLLK